MHELVVKKVFVLTMARMALYSHDLGANSANAPSRHVRREHPWEFLTIGKNINYVNW